MSKQQINKVIADHLGIKVETVTEEKNLIDDLGADSLDTVEIVMAMEEEFDIEIPVDHEESLKTVGHFHEYINSRLGEGNV